MAGFTGDPDELPVMAAWLRGHVTWSQAFQADVMARCRAVSRRVEAAVAQLERELRQAEAQFNATAPEHRHEAAAAVAQARHKLALGLVARRETDEALRRAEACIRTGTARSVTVAERGSASLRRFWSEINRATKMFDSAVARILGGVALRAAATMPSQSRSIGSSGHTLVPLAAIDDSDSQVSGPQDFGKTSYQAIRTALTRLEEKIIPAVQAGAGLEKMRELDERAGLAGDPASYVRTYQAFFGDGDREILLSRGQDGQLTVINGYHRIWAARQVGVDELPVRIKETP